MSLRSRRLVRLFIIIIIVVVHLRRLRSNKLPSGPRLRARRRRETVTENLHNIITSVLLLYRVVLCTTNGLYTAQIKSSRSTSTPTLRPLPRFTRHNIIPPA